MDRLGASARGIDVIGDVERPAAGAAAPRTRRGPTPTGPRRPQMVNAALDALAALTLEAAARPDPHEQLAARIGRAARRLRRR